MVADAEVAITGSSGWARLVKEYGGL